VGGSSQRLLTDFGRFPHRNGVLGRISTPEEIEFLQQPDATSDRSLIALSPP
jgi:uncharacterized protein (DUF924 family)